MADIKRKFGPGNQAITITLASLASDAARQSTEIDNSSNLYLDAMLQLKIKAGGAGISSSGNALVFAYGTSDGGTTRTENAGASDAAITLVNPTALKFLGAVPMVATGVTYVGGPWSVAAAFGGVLPEKWGIVVHNMTGVAFDSAEGSHLKIYQGILAQVG